MISRFLKTAAALLLVLSLSVSAAQASGKMEVRLGEKVTLKAEDAVSGTTYKWVIRKGNEILASQTGTLFTYEFEQAGEYQVNLTTTDSSEAIRTTSILVMAGQRFPRPEDEVKKPDEGAAFTLTTLPPLAEGRVRVIGQSKVLFHMQGGPDILEYRVDQNIYQDSDGDGTANDDVDNASDESYLRGGYFEAYYDPADSAKVVAEVTAVARDGSKTKKQVEVIFNPASQKAADPYATFYTIPAPNADDQTVILYGEEAMVGFYAEESAGNLAEYRIDTNIFFDSDKDGDPANDIDNRNHESFKTGDIFTATYRKTDGQIIAQLIVVSADGKGSRLQRALRFSDQPPASFKDYERQIRLVGDKSFVLAGDPIALSVLGLALALDHYTFAWDFEGDGVTDQETQGENSVTHIYEVPGTMNPQVTVTDTSGNRGDFTLELLVKDALRTAANFEFTVEGNQVTFKNFSTAAQNLAEKTLRYQWSFGDTDEAGFTAQKDQIGAEHPLYTYRKAGTYLVTLTVTDADKVTHSITGEVAIEQDLKEEDQVEKAEDEEREEEEASIPGEEKGGSLVVKILKILLYVIGVILVLAILLFGGFLVFLKIQHPDLTLGELIDEFKMKLLTKMGIEDEMIEHQKEPAPAKSPAAPVPPVPKKEPEILEGEVEEAPPAPKPAPKPVPSAPAAPKSPEPPAPSAPAEDVIPPKHPPATGELAKPEGPVPDWLKGL